MYVPSQLRLQVPTGRLGSLRLLLEPQQLVQADVQLEAAVGNSRSVDLPVCGSALASARPASRLQPEGRQLSVQAAPHLEAVRGQAEDESPFLVPDSSALCCQSEVQLRDWAGCCAGSLEAASAAGAQPLRNRACHRDTCRAAALQFLALMAIEMTDYRSAAQWATRLSPPGRCTASAGHHGRPYHKSSSTPRLQTAALVIMMAVLPGWGMLIPQGCCTTKVDAAMAKLPSEVLSHL